MSYTVKPYPWYRKLVHDATRLGMEKPYIKALGEANITEIRQKLKKYNKTEKVKVSLTAYLIYCLAKVVKQYPNVQSYKSWNNKIYTFNEVDVLIPIQLKIDDDNFLSPFVLKKANNKTLTELQEVITKASEKKELHLDSVQKIFLKLPWCIRKPIYKLIFKLPISFKRQVGTISFSPLHMFVKHKSYGIGIPQHTTGTYTGGIHTQNNKTILPFTIQVNHDLVDGAYLAKFYSTLITEIEKGEFE